MKVISEIKENLSPFLVKNELVETNEKDYERRWTVYYHQNKINGKIYVGITGKKPEWRWGIDGIGYEKQPFYNAILKYGWNNFHHEIFATNLTRDEACDLEVIFIDKFQLLKDKYGYNASEGGKNVGKKRKERPIYQYKLTGEFVKYWDDIDEVARELNCRRDTIDEVCKGTKKSCKGYIFKYNKDDKVTPKNYFFSREHPILQYSLMGDFIGKYNNIYEASCLFHIKTTYIRYSCEGKRQTAGGYFWFCEDSFDENELLSKVKTYKESLDYHLWSYSVEQYDLYDNLIKTYDDFHQVEQELNFDRNQIRNCYKATQNVFKTICGYKWKAYPINKINKRHPYLFLQEDKQWENVQKHSLIFCVAMMLTTLENKTITPIQINGFIKDTSNILESCSNVIENIFLHRIEQLNFLDSDVHKKAKSIVDNGGYIIACYNNNYVVWYNMKGNYVLLNNPCSANVEDIEINYDYFIKHTTLYLLISKNRTG